MLSAEKTNARKKRKGAKVSTPLSWARMPRSVWADSQLSDFDVRVFAALTADSWSTRYAVSSVRSLASELGCSHGRVAKALQSLCAAGHIEQAPRQRGQMAAYRLTSPVFAPAKKIVSDATGVGVVVESTGKRTKCGKCKKAAVVGSSGICGPCLAEWVKTA